MVMEVESDPVSTSADQSLLEGHRCPCLLCLVEKKLTKHVKLEVVVVASALDDM